MQKMDTAIRELHEIEAVCFGDFTLKSGIQSPIYVDARLTMGRPKLLMDIAANMWSRCVESNCKVDIICGVPTGAIPLATCMSTHSGLPMIIVRKETKDYGRKRPIEGTFKPGQRCLVVEDVFVSGQSTMETVDILRKYEFIVEDVVVFLDREHGGKTIIEREGVTLHSALTMTSLLNSLRCMNLIGEEMQNKCIQFMESVQLKALPRHVDTAKKLKKLSYKRRTELCSHSMTKRLFEIIVKKKTNLALSADVTSCCELIEIADELGPYICILKTHVDILEDFQLKEIMKLTHLAKKHEFLIFEDRKFADIGNTVQLQYRGGIYKMVEWSDMINAHPLPGPGVIQGLKNVGKLKDQACVLVAEMSSEDHLCSKEYIQKTVEIANRNKDFVIGFICQSYLTADPEMVHMIPGVRLEEGSDGLGQKYITPKDAFNSGADIVIIGRGILKAENRVKKAIQYQEISYNAYCEGAEN